MLKTDINLTSDKRKNVLKQKARTRIKICGMTETAQVEHAVSLGVDAIGMILHANSPRVASLEQAKLIRDVVPAFVSLVGVFVDADHALIEQSINEIGLDIVQLHGNETESFAQTLSRPYIKAIRAKSAEQVVRDCRAFPSARSVLLDPYVQGQHGGTGTALDAQLWPNELEGIPLILAGGLSADNVAQRISELSPFAVDLNSGIESLPGMKDPRLLANAVNEVYMADLQARENSNDS